MISQDQIRSQLDNCLLEAKFDRWANHYQKGKVRDIYLLDDKRILITTDRQSAFDHVLGAIPLKGQVLNKTAKYWFDQTADIVPNQVLDVPDPQCDGCARTRHATRRNRRAAIPDRQHRHLRVDELQ